MTERVPPTAGGLPTATDLSGVALAHESGLDVQARSQWSYVRMRFFRHRLAVASLVVLVLIGLVGVFAPQLAPYGYDEIPLATITESQNRSPTFEGWHLFGTDQLGRDELSRVMFWNRTSLWVALLLTASVFFGSGDPLKIGVILACLFWTAIARIVRGLFLSRRLKEFVEGA